jgi:hypothetical protein
MKTSTVMVRYKTTEDGASTNERLVHAVFDELRASRPEGVRYATFRLPDGVSFVHVATIDAFEGEHPLTSLAAFKAFTKDIRERCVELPATTELTLVDSYSPSSRVV